MGSYPGCVCMCSRASGTHQLDARSTNPQSALSLIGLSARSQPADTGRTCVATPFTSQVIQRVSAHNEAWHGYGMSAGLLVYCVAAAYTET